MIELYNCSPMTMVRERKVREDTEVEMSKMQWLHKSKDKLNRHLDLKLVFKNYVMQEATEIMYR